MFEIFGVAPEVNADMVATDEDEFDLVGLAALTEGVGKEGCEGVDGDGRVWDDVIVT